MSKTSKKINYRDAHYRSCYLMSKFCTTKVNEPIRTNTQLCCFDKQSGQWLNHGNSMTASKILFESKSFTKNAEDYFTGTENNFKNILNAFLQIPHERTEIYSRGNLDFLYNFIALEIARNPQSVKTLLTIRPELNDVDIKSEVIMDLIPQLASAFKFQLKWSFWIFKISDASITNPLILPDVIYSCTNILQPNITFIMMPISYTHCVIAVKDRNTIVNNTLIFDTSIINYLSYKASKRFFVVDPVIHNACIPNLDMFYKTVENDPVTHPKYSCWWKTDSVLKT